MTEDADAPAAALPENVDDAEKRLRRLMEKRNLLNDEARELAEERDQLNTERRRLLDGVADERAKQQALHEELQQHKARRTELQRRAKELIEVKKARRGGSTGGQIHRVRELEAEIKALEFRHETTPMSPVKEKELMEELQRRKRELAEARKLASEESVVLKDIVDIDAEIDRLFKDADLAHAEVMRLADGARAIGDAIAPVFKQVDALRDESDRRHAGFVKARERADHFHGRIVELREHVIGLKGEEAHELAEAQREIRERHEEVERVLSDEESVNELVDTVLEKLKKGGKIEL